MAKLQRFLSVDDGSAIFVTLLDKKCSPDIASALTSAAGVAMASGRFKTFAGVAAQPGSVLAAVPGLLQYLLAAVDARYAAYWAAASTAESKWTHSIESAYNHVRWCHHVASASWDRLHHAEGEVLGRRLHAALSHTHDPVAVVGPAGCGKSWLVGRAAVDFANACQSESRQCVVLVRFCGLGSTVGTYSRLMHDVLCQLHDALPTGAAASTASLAAAGPGASPAVRAATADLKYGSGGGGNDQLFSSFRHALVAAAEAHPSACILLVFDGLDYLLDAGRTTAFLAALSDLPPGLVVLVSVKEPSAAADTSAAAADANAWYSKLQESGSLVKLPEAMPSPSVAEAFAARLLASVPAAALVLATVSRIPLYLASMAIEVASAAVTGRKSAGGGPIWQSLIGKPLTEAMQVAMATDKNENSVDGELLFCSTLELSCFETAKHVSKVMELRKMSTADLWHAYLEAAAYRLKKCDLLFDVIVGGCRAYIWKHSAFGQDWSQANEEPVAWLGIQAERLQQVLLNVFTAKNLFSAQLGPELPSYLTENDEKTKGGSKTQTTATATMKHRLLYILPTLLCKYCASVFDFSRVLLFFFESKEMKDLVFATYCGYNFITTKLRYSGVRSLLHDFEDFLAVWAFKFESARTNVERTGLTAFEQLYAFFVTHEKRLAQDPTAFEAVLTGTVGIDISMEHDRVAVMYELAQNALASRQALRLSTASMRIDSSKFDSRCVCNNVKNMMLRREKQYYATTIIDNKGVHLSHNGREEVRVWRYDGTLMFDQALEGKVLCCTAVKGKANVFAVATTQINADRELTLLTHCVGDCYSYRAGDLGPRDAVAAWMTPDAMTLVLCEKVSADTLKVKLCRPAPVILSQVPHDELTSAIGKSKVPTTFISRFLEVPQLVEDVLYDEAKEHAEREGGSERTELKYYSSVMAADTPHYKLDVAGLDADADGMHAMRYLWNEMRQHIDSDNFSLPIDEVCSANLKLNGSIARSEVTVLGWLEDSNVVVIRAVTTEEDASTIYVLRAMSDGRLELQKELTMDAMAAYEITRDGLLIYADSSTPLTLWNLGANEKDVLESATTHGSGASITCLHYAASAAQVYAFSTTAASMWDVKSCGLTKSIQWQMSSNVTAAAVADKWLVVGLENGEIHLYDSWRHVSSVIMQGRISSMYIGKVDAQSISFSCVHKGQPSASIAFLTWSPEVVQSI